MRALNLWWINPTTILFFICLSCGVNLLSAQATSPRKRIRRTHAIAPFSSIREEANLEEVLQAEVDHRTFPAAFSYPALPQRPEHQWERAPTTTTSLLASPRSSRQPVNFNLLLPPRSGKRPSWTTDASTGNAVPDRDLMSPSAFASSLPTPDQETVNIFNDPQDYARRIPGVGPIVDRVLKQSKAHPRLTRILKSIQPQF
jgi:hypothetical protein